MAISDSQPAFKSLYMAYFPKLMRFVSLYVSSSVETEEIVSDTLLAVWSSRNTLPDITNFDSYIYAIARNKVVSYYRIKQIKKVDLEENDIDLFIHTDTTPEEELINKESIARLNAAINSLPNKCKLAFKLVREDKLKYREVATILDISIKTLEAHLATAVRKLRETLSKDTTL